jgi:polyisoprenoid-binding protein YceI
MAFLLRIERWFMNIRTIGIALVSAVMGALIGVFGYIWIIGGSGTPTGETVAPTLDVNAIATQSPDTLLTQLANAQAEIGALQTQVSDLQAGTTITEVEATAETDAAAETVNGRILYRIDPRDSRVTFTMQETLQGTPTTVIGGTDQIAGDVIIDFDNPAQSQIGTLRINARTLVTAEEMRNRAIRAEILRSREDEFEFIEFAPTQLNDLPETIVVGETYLIEIVGDLTIVGTTRSVTFDADVTINEADVISGTASATVLYADWGITIPDAPGVADITDEVTLAIEFVARAVEE